MHNLRPPKPVSLSLIHRHRPKPFPSRQCSAKLLVIADKSSWVTHLLERFSGYIASHVSSLASREKGGVADVVDPLFPLLTCLWSWVDEFQSLSIDCVDCIPDPATLNFDAGRTIAEECRPVRTIQMEHVGISRNGCTKISELSVTQYQ